MATIIIKRTVNLDGPIMPESLGAPLYQSENQAHQFVIECTRGGAPIALAGTVQARMIRPDGDTVAITGSISGGKAVLVLPQAAYAYQGRFALAIINVASGVTTVLYAAMGDIRGTTTGSTIDPGSVVPDITQLLAEIDEMHAATASANQIINSVAKQTTFFDITKQEEGVYIDADGEIQETALYRLSDYLPVIPGQAYRANVGTQYLSARFGGFYDAEKTFLSTCISASTAEDNGEYVFVAPAGAAYVRVCYTSDDEADQKITPISPVNVITPEMYGAVGDGETDDYRAFARMIAALQNRETKSRTVLCQGSYYLGNTVVINEGNGLINFVGLDSRAYTHTFILKRSASESVYPLFSVRDTGVSFDGVTFKGVETIPMPSDTQGAGVAIIYDLQTATASLNGNIDAHVRNCEFVLFATAIRVYGQNLKIEECLFSRCSFGVSFESAASDYASELKGYVLQNNRFHQLQTAINNTAALQGRDGRSTLITGNLADIVFRFYNGYGTNLTMTGNEVTFVPYGGNSLVNLLDEGLDSYCLISGNTFDAVATTPSNPACNICLESVTPVVLTNNLFKHSAQHGVKLSGSANGSKVANNVFRDCGGLEYYAIDLETAGNTYFINDNLTGTTNGNNGIGGAALETSVLSNNYVGVVS